MRVRASSAEVTSLRCECAQVSALSADLSLRSGRERLFSPCEAGAACEALWLWFFTTSFRLLQVSFYRKQYRNYRRLM